MHVTAYETDATKRLLDLSLAGQLYLLARETGLTLASLPENKASLS